MIREFNRYHKSVFIGEKSVRFIRTSTYCPGGKQIEKRGKINRFSRHSALRLRKALAEYHLNHSLSFGVTLTLPWQVSEFVKSPFYLRKYVNYDAINTEYKKAFNRFGVFFRRIFPNSAAIFRHELQSRKMPHCHLVIYFSRVDLPFRVFDVKKDDIRLYIRKKMYELWQSAICFQFHGGDVEGFFRRGIDVTYLEDMPAIFRYIGDHTSKKKQAQLGYRGKQWGFLNRSLLIVRHFTRLDFKDSHELVLFQRAVTKLCRFKIQSRINWKGERVCLDDKVFGSKLSSRRRLCSIQFVDFSSALKIFNWIRSLR